MAARVTDTGEDRQIPTSWTRRWRMASKAAGFAYRVLLVLGLCCVAGLVYLLFVRPLPLCGILQFAQWAIVCGAYAALSKSILTLFERASCDSRMIFSAACASSLKRMGAVFLILLGTGTAFSLAVVLLAHGGVLGVSLGLPLRGFPSSATWEAAFSGIPPEGIPQYVSLDLSYLFAALVTWCLSAAFEYGAALQEDNDAVV